LKKLEDQHSLEINELKERNEKMKKLNDKQNNK
jgi:hypothetical protein